MGRPLGSKNKPKEVTPETAWTPSPDMGAIKPPPEGEKVCVCIHKADKHYGGPKGWCNVNGCNCPEFRS